MTLAEVADVLNISMPQAYALVRSGELPAIQIGGKKQWRVEPGKLEEFVAQAYLDQSQSQAGLEQQAPAGRELDEPDRG
jgi:excisionase family DNA binding protein